jgi:hypothetical protein
VKDVLFDGAFGINISTEDIKKKFELSIPKLVFYHLKMINQTIVKPIVGLIKN